MAAKNLFFSPRDAREAGEIFRACSRVAEAGRKIRVGIVESPFRPSAGIPLPGSHSATREIESIAASDEAFALVSHGAMNAIHEISTSDLLAVVDGGVAFGDFLSAVGKAGLYFPHEPDVLLRDATIAEIIMDGSIFGTEGRFGGLREYILSIEIVTPRGELIKAGSRSVKDVTGYDVAGFLMGSGGRCGMISRATIRLLSAPGTRLPFACIGDSGGMEAFMNVIHRKLKAAFLEIFEDNAALVLLDHIARAASSADARALIVGELQASEPGTEDELLSMATDAASRGLSVWRLDPRAIEAYRSFPLLVLDAQGGEGALLHLSDDFEPTAAKLFGAYSCMSLYPGRRHGYFPFDGTPGEPAATISEAGRRVRMEIIERRGDGVVRRRIHGVKSSRAPENRSNGSHHDAGAKGRSVAADLEGRMYRAFDPQEIMIP